VLFLGEKNGFMIVVMIAHEVYVSVIKLLDYLLPIIHVILLEGWSDLLIKPPQFSLISRISLPDLGRISSEVWVSNLRSGLVLPMWVSISYSESLHHFIHSSG
jgi:hypothetical protein